MAQLIMSALALALMGVLTGIYWSVEIHDRRIDVLTASQYMAMHQMRDATFAKVMPFVGLGTLIVVVVSVGFALGTGWPRWIGAIAMMLIIADIVMTISRQVPLNQEVQSWSETTIPAHWRSVRDQWAAQHRLRLALCTLAYCALLVAVFMTWTR
jgi:hypothetical protein